MPTAALADLRRAYALATLHRADLDPASWEPLAHAFASVPREDFVGPPPWWLGGSDWPGPSHDPADLYSDCLVVLDRRLGLNNGQPSLHAQCLALLDPHPGHTVVHVGAGTGYYSAILAELVGAQGHVHAYECEPGLAARATPALAPWQQVSLHPRSALEGPLPDCDRLYVSAGVSELPAAWLDALRPEGGLMLPLTGAQGGGCMLWARREVSGWAATLFDRVAFVACRGARSELSERSLEAALRTRPLSEVRSLRRDTPPDDSCWCAGTGWWLSTR